MSDTKLQQESWPGELHFTKLVHELGEPCALLFFTMLDQIDKLREVAKERDVETDPFDVAAALSYCYGKVAGFFDALAGR